MLEVLLGRTVALHLDTSGACRETLWHLTWTLEVLLGRTVALHLDTSGARWEKTMAPHLDA